MKKCRVCNIEKNENKFGIRKYKGRINGRRNICKECDANRNKEDRKSDVGIKRYNEYDRSPRRRFRKSMTKANDKKIMWDITEKEYSNLIDEKCYYCNGYFPPVEKGIGLDRIDSSMGYILSNVVSCCRICNVVKNNFLTAEETKAAITAVIQIREKNKNA